MVRSSGERFQFYCCAMRFFTCFKVFLAKKKGNQCLRLIGIHRIQTFQPSTFNFKMFSHLPKSFNFQFQIIQANIE